jgi:nucleoside-diphosphate-sugar epimerase
MILVTGGTGLLGSHLLYEVVRQKAEVVALKRPTSDLEEVKRVFGYYSEEGHKIFKQINWIDADLMNQADLEQCLIDVDQVYHCAGMVSFQPRDRAKMIHFNTNSTANLVNACLANGVKKVVHVSSTSAIGKPPDSEPANESMIWARSKTNTGYSESKFLSEMEVWRGMEEGLNGVIVNPSIILGAGFWERGSSAIFSRVAKGLKFAAPGITGYVGVQDVVSSMIQLMNSDISGERFIISGGNFSYRQVFEMIGQALGKPKELKLVSATLMKNLVKLDGAAGFFTRKRRITSEMVRSAFSEVHFSTEKIQEALDIRFTPLEQVIEQVALHYLNDHKS